MPHVDKLILEMLANRTLPTCIQSNIVAFCGHILPEQDVIKEVPSAKHIQNMRTVQQLECKSLNKKHKERIMKGKEKQSSLATDYRYKLKVKMNVFKFVNHNLFKLTSFLSHFIILGLSYTD